MKRTRKSLMMLLSVLLCVSQLLTGDKLIASASDADNTAYLECEDDSLFIDCTSYEHGDIIATKTDDVANAFVPAVSDYPFIVIDGNVSQDTYNAVLEKYLMVPLNVRENFQISGWHLIITDMDLNAVFYNNMYPGGVIGSTYYKQKTIHVENSKGGINAVTHEMGHFMDSAVYGANLRVARSGDWEKIIKENEKLIWYYNTTQPLEKFAEAFAMYCENPEKLKKISPEAYNFVDVWQKQVPGVDAIQRAEQEKLTENKDEHIIHSS